MANQWYVQQGGKQYGPLTSANLKKLATEGKISEATSVRLGAEGTWVPAARVQGLFAAPSASAPPAAPALAKAVAPPPLAEAIPASVPPAAPPLARPALGSFGSPAKAVPAQTGSMPAMLLGAVALILGTLALATFWLPYLGPMGWTGIVVGGLGLLLGIGGFVFSAMHQGAGLYLNIAGVSSSVVGLTLTVVFAVVFGMFQSAPSPPAPVLALPTPVKVAPPMVEAAPIAEPEPEPEAPPEPVWTDAGESITQGAIKASIASAKVESVRLESSDLATLKRQKPQPMLKIRLTIENITPDKIVEVPGWVGGGDAIGHGLDKLLEGSELGKAVQSAVPSATLVDSAGNAYKQTSMLSIFGARLPGGESAVRPGQSINTELVFPPPLDSIEYLRLELSPAGFSGSEPLRFAIPQAFIEKPAT